MLGGLGRLLGGSGRGSVGGIHATVGADISDYERKMRQADQTMKRTASSMAGELDKGARTISSGLEGIGAAVGIGGALVLAKQVGSAVTELNALGAESQRMSAAFVEQWGERAPAAMETLRAASHGAISDMDLMLSANRAKMLHVTDDYNELGRLLEVATARGRAMGISTQQAFNDLVTGIGRLSPMILDNLGIVTDAENTYKTYAASIGKAATELTDYEKRAALVAKVTADVGTVTLDAAGKQEALQAAKANLRGEIGLLVTAFIDESGAVETLTGKLNGLREALEFERNASAAAAEAKAQFHEALIRTDRAIGLGEKRYHELSKAARDYEAALRDNRISIDEFNAEIGTLIRELNIASGLYTANDRAMENEARDLYAISTAAYAAAAGMNEYNASAITMAWKATQPANLRDPSAAYAIDTSAGASTFLIGGGAGATRRANELAATLQMEQAAYSKRLQAQSSYQSEAERLAQQSFDRLRGIVESALSPTAVTAADLAATAAGTYVDKWDEYMRRIRMPESGLGADQIAEQERLFYSGQMLDQINWGAVVADVERKIQEEAGREAMIQEAMRQVQMAGIGATQAQVAGALGITDYKALGAEQGQMLAAGMRADGLAVKFTEEYESEWIAQQQRWVSMGKMSVTWMAEGMEAGATPDVTHRLINILVPRVAEVLTGGARP